jgi:hypothetical protein
MKQITLTSNRNPVPVPCTGWLVWTWGLYGYAMWLLWQASGGNPWGQAVTWLVAAAVGLGLMLALREV